MSRGIWSTALVALAAVFACAAAEPAALQDSAGAAPAVVPPGGAAVAPGPDAAPGPGATASTEPQTGESPVYKLRPVPFTDGGAQVVTLDELLELALNNSAALKQQGNAIEKSRFVVDQTYYSYDPDLSAALGFGRQSSAGGAGLGGAGGSSGDSYSSSFGVTKPFEYGDTLGFKYDLSRGKSGAGTAASSVGYGAGYSFSYARPLLRGAGKYINRIPRFIASNNAQLACGKLDDNVRKLKQSVIDAFYRAVAARQGIEVRQSALELALKQLDRSVERYKAGLAIEADVLQSENAVLTQRSALLSAGSGYKALLDQLTTLVGLPQEYALAVDADGALLDLGGELPEDLWDLVQANSYDLKSLNTSLANARLSLDQQMNQLKPNVGLSLSYGRSGADTGIGHALTGYESDNLQVGLNWSGKRGERAAKAGVAQSELDLASLQLQIQDAELQLKSAVRGLQRDLETKYEQIGLAQSNLDVLQKTYDIMSERNSAGLATALDVIEAQEGVLGGQLALLQAQVAYHETYRSLLVMAGLL